VDLERLGHCLSKKAHHVQRRVVVVQRRVDRKPTLVVPHGDGRVPRFEEELRHFQRCVRVGHPHVQGQPTSVVLGLEGHRSLLDEELDDVQQHLLVLVLPPLVVLAARGVPQSYRCYPLRNECQDAHNPNDSESDGHIRTRAAMRLASRRGGLPLCFG
jgi:hypothetical protein